MAKSAKGIITIYDAVASTFRRLMGPKFASCYKDSWRSKQCQHVVDAAGLDGKKDTHAANTPARTFVLAHIPSCTTHWRKLSMCFLTTSGSTVSWYLLVARRGLLEWHRRLEACAAMTDVERAGSLALRASGFNSWARRVALESAW